MEARRGTFPYLPGVRVRSHPDVEIQGVAVHVAAPQSTLTQPRERGKFGFIEASRVMYLSDGIGVSISF